jgi:hypothetical protein
MQGFPSVLLGTTCTSVLEINKTVIVASSWSSIFTLPTGELFIALTQNDVRGCFEDLKARMQLYVDLDENCFELITCRYQNCTL